ncbi:MAG TPA: dihydroorotate dehydrogenase electron transfer subunit [Solirubrobacteraceae bacterium]
MTRVLAPLGRRACTVTSNDAVGAYRVLRVADPDGPEPWPGQFYMLATVERWGAGDDERPYLPRAFSYLRAVDGELHFMLEDVGPGTARLGQAARGEQLWVLGPLGAGFRLPEAGRAPVLCGGGVGAAPLAALQDRLGDAVTLLGFRDEAHAPGAALMRDARVATDDGSVGHHGFVTDLLAGELDGDDHVVVYACGPPPMLEAVRALCAERAVPAQLALESGMACGYGACFGCVVPTRDGYVRLCVDGPVLEAAALDEVA